MRNLSDTDIATKTGLDAAKTVSRKVAHKTAEATGEFIANKTAEKKCENKVCIWWKFDKC